MTAARAAHAHAENASASLDAWMHRLVRDLHTADPRVFWADMIGSALVGWTGFALAVMSRPLSVRQSVGVVVSIFALYRGLCFIHELTHLRRGALRGFETAWNCLFGIPLLLPSFTYIGVHQDHHNVGTYGTRSDPEYLPFARSPILIWTFSAQSALLLPLLLVLRFVLLAPVALAWPAFHRWLLTHASSFSMNPAYRRKLAATETRKIRSWEIALLAVWLTAVALIVYGVLPARTVAVWFWIVVGVSFLNTLRVLGAHGYEANGDPLDRSGQLRDSIDTPGGPWTELWAPVGLRYHALHHFFPGIPYHNLGIAYRRLTSALPSDAEYRDSSSKSLRASLVRLYAKALAASHRNS